MAIAVIKSKIRKGDTVMVISGREAGKTGKVLSVNTAKGKVLIEKLNVVKRHTKPNQKNKQGGILEREAPLAISNVMYFDANLNKPVRLGIRVLEDGRRVRVSRPGGQAID
ncbi:MAG: 50S ribosomal protein L24 [Nitrospira sp.]|nr:MAG: 50S ribosomal protein L24 [Nitrospira sp.]